MTLWGNGIPPQVDGFVYGKTEPKVPGLWFHEGDEVPFDPDGKNGMLCYRDFEGKLHAMYPMTTVAMVNGLELRFQAMAEADAGVLETVGNLVGNLTVTIPKDGWEKEAATVKAAGVSAQNTVIVSSSPENHDAYGEAGVRCTGQGAGELTFGCSSPPDTDLKVNVLILNPVKKDVSEHYAGSYSVAPSREKTVLETQDKILDDNITVQPISYYQVSNLAGGDTAYIGEPLK